MAKADSTADAASVSVVSQTAKREEYSKTDLRKTHMSFGENQATDVLKWICNPVLQLLSLHRCRSR